MSLILIHEPKSYWSAELSREFLNQNSGDESPPTFRWRPYREELLEEASSATLIVLVCEPTDDSLNLLTQLRSRSLHAELVALVSAEADSWEWAARELGVAAVFSDCTSPERVAFSVQNLLTSQRSAQSTPLVHP